MPDLGLAIDFTSNASLSDLPERFRRALSGGREYSVCERIQQNVVAVNLLKPFSQIQSQPIENGQDWMMIDGAIYSDRPLSSCINDLFSCDTQRVSKVNGQFNAVVYHHDLNQITIITDRFGLRPIYWTKHRNSHFFSSEVKALEAASQKSFDFSPVGLIELFAFGHNIADRTVFDGVSVLPPGSMIRISEEGQIHERYYRFSFNEDEHEQSIAAWGRELSDILGTAMGKYIKAPGRPAIFLSGGLDSRFMAAAMANAEPGIPAFTFGDPGSSDVRFGQKLAERLGLPHTVLPYPDGYLSSTLHQVVDRTECTAPFFHTSSIVFHDRIADQADRIFVGFCGDILSGGHLKRAMVKSPKTIDISAAIFRRALLATKESIAQVLQPQLVEAHWPEFLEGFKSTVENIDEMNPANIADVWDMENRQRRFTFPASKVDRGRFEVIAPLLDTDFVNTVARMPVSARWQQSAYRNAIVEGFPSIRSVPWTKTGNPVRADQLRFETDELIRKFGLLTSRIVRGTVGRRATTRSGYRDLADTFRRDVRLLSTSPKGVAKATSLPPEYFSHDSITRLTEEHLGGQDHSHLLGTALTAMSWIEGRGNRFTSQG